MLTVDDREITSEDIEQIESVASEMPDELSDFREFLCLVWRTLGLSDPTPLQYQIADIIQNIAKDCGLVPFAPDPEFATKYPMLLEKDGSICHRLIIEAYRGFGKSWICAAAMVWILAWNPAENCMAISAAKVKSDEFTTFALQLIRDIEVLNFLTPDRADGDRSSALAFDVRGHGAAQAPSARSIGIFGMVTGGRAGAIFLDDIEVPKTSETQALRDKLSERSKEPGGAVLKPGGFVMVLGTPQCEETIYDVMCRERGYRRIVFPARYPGPRWMEHNSECLAPSIAKQMRKRGPKCQTGCGLDGTLGEPTDPKRFGELELQQREGEYGRSGFQLQFMLDTTLSDRERYPLKLRDLVIMDIPPRDCPESIVWASGPEQVIVDLPNVGFKGDRFHRPMRVSDEWIKYTGSVMFIDPAGRGKDELGYAVVKAANGYLYCVACCGLRGGYERSNLVKLAHLAKQYGVQEIVTEPNFGDGMFDILLGEVLREHYPCTITPAEHSRTQKEHRIIDTLEPVLNQHLLIMDPSVINGDLAPHDDEGEQTALGRSLLHQMTRITREKGCLPHDDRLDALAGAVGYWRNALGVDRDKTALDRKTAAGKALAMTLGQILKRPQGAKGRSKNSWIERHSGWS